MAIFKELLSADIKTQRSSLNQLVDVLQEDISGSVSRRKYQQFVTGGVGPGVTSSLFQTVYDQDFTLQTANPIFDITFGLNPIGSTVAATQTGTASGKELFPSSSLMMREKMDVYRQFAQSLLGSADTTFTAPFNSTTTTDQMDAALFIAFKRLFSRDQIKRETFAMRFYKGAAIISPIVDGASSNLNVTSEVSSSIYTDVGSSTNKLVAFGGQVGNVIDAADTSNTVGLLFYDRGILVLDMAKITSGSQFVSGTIDAMRSPTGQQDIGRKGTETALSAKFIPDFIASASIDNVIDHIAACRLSSGSITAMTFQNVTSINSSLIFCRASADEFNYSSNPTYIDDSRIVVIDKGQEDVQQSFTFITGIGLYDSNDNLLAVAKVSRPIEKSSERDITLRIRLDF